jgi:hypothetical protein
VNIEVEALGDESCGDGPNDPIGQCRDHWWLRFINYVKRNLDRRAAKKQQEKPADKAARVTATATKWMAFFTLVLCLSSIATAEFPLIGPTRFPRLGTT